MLVRRAAPEDAGSIAAVDVASWRAAYTGLMPAAYLTAMSVEDSTARWTGSLQREESRGKRTLVVETEGGILGYATVGPDGESNRGMLYLMYVLPESWGLGAGRALMQGAREALLDLGHPDVVLWVLEANERARRFYVAAGWRADGSSHLNDYGGVQLAAIRMVASL